MTSAPRPGGKQPELSSHDAVVGALPKPHWLESESLLDHLWTIRLDDPEAARRAAKSIYFDVVLAPGGIRSTHPSFAHDLITAKLLVFGAQQPKFLGGITASSGFTPTIAREYFSFVRWRVSRGIPSNAALTPDWLDEFFSALRSRGPLISEIARSFLGPIKPRRDGDGTP